MTDEETFLARAADARAEAEAATLDNVRERCLRSEAAWNEMAARVAHVQKLREQRDAEKTAANLSDA